MVRSAGGATRRALGIWTVADPSPEVGFGSQGEGSFGPQGEFGFRIDDWRKRAEQARCFLSMERFIACLAPFKKSAYAACPCRPLSNRSCHAVTAPICQKRC